MRIRALTSYDGTAYAGWQRQISGQTIQGAIENALFVLMRQKISIQGAGRTDAGAHARGQVFHCDIEGDEEKIKILLPILLDRLNGFLPKDIRILNALVATPDFHAQKSAKRKRYSYTLQTARQLPPFGRLYRVKVPYFCLKTLRQAANHLIGMRDFSALANRGGSVKTFVRTLYGIDVVEIEGCVRLDFTGSGFLYKMVRNCVGLLLEIAMGKRDITTIDALLLSGDRTRAAAAAPARGLCLEHIDYSPEIFWPD